MALDEYTYFTLNSCTLRLTVYLGCLLVDVTIHEAA
jgi:hypothetical protein